MNLSLSLSSDAPVSWLDQDLVETVQEIAEGFNPPHGTVEMVVVDDPYIQRINSRYRHIDTPTDVISFSYLEDVRVEVGDDDIVGEIYLSHETIEKEASELGIDVKHLFLRISVHGILHVLGSDHQTDEEAEQMEQEEKKVLERYLATSEIDALF